MRFTTEFLSEIVQARIDRNNISCAKMKKKIANPEIYM